MRNIPIGSSFSWDNLPPAQFLGRDPDREAFLREIRGKPSGPDVTKLLNPVEFRRVQERIREFQQELLRMATTRPVR